MIQEDIFAFLVEPECIKLAENGELDLIVCISNLGNYYLRARKGSTINGNLDDLIVKEKKHK